jgi:hypothetical protein
MGKCVRFCASYLAGSGVYLYLVSHPGRDRVGVHLPLLYRSPHTHCHLFLLGDNLVP